MEQDLSDSLSASRLMARLLTLFAALAVLLAAVGLYGVVSYGVSQQTRELCIRLALGARPLEVLRMVLSDGTRPALVGIGVGGAVALLSAHALRSLLFGISPADPATFAFASAGLLLVALVASYIPARRATRVDPLTALR
jgi:putative ABC transport system permease protein